jgi:hypothetical protein
MFGATSCSQLRAGDVVDVLPSDETAEANSIEIGYVFVVGPELIILTDGRPYSLRDGLGFGSGFGTRIRPANAVRMALTRVRKQNRSKSGRSRNTSASNSEMSIGQ